MTGVSDPRLRLLGTGVTDSLSVTRTDTTAAVVLRRLDETEVVVAVASDADDRSRVAAAAFVTMVARLVPRVRIRSEEELPLNWWQATSWANLLDRLDAVRPVTDLPAQRRITVGFGVLEPGCDIYVGGGDWNVVISDRPVPLEAENEHGLGIHAAACFAISQILIKLLGEFGFPGVEVAGMVETNLIDHGLYRINKCKLTSVDLFTRLPAAFLGVGSVGTSAIALLATVCSPMLNPASSMAGATAAALELTAVDKDEFDPNRNPFRYPALLGGETGKKATGMVDRLRELGLSATASDNDVAGWNLALAEPGWKGVVISSVDTLTGRLDVADVLGERTLSAGVSGTELHVQWEGFADGLACPFCDFVRATPPMTQAGVYAEITGIPVSRILALLQDGALIEASDVEMAIASGRVPPHRRDALVGAPLSDLIRQAYAEAEIRPQGDPSAGAAEVVAVASPQVSWFTGTLVAAELVKHLLGLPTLDQRVDIDVAGLPAGAVRRPLADSTGTCICHSGVRRRWHRMLYGPSSTPPSALPVDFARGQPDAHPF
jgi:hypothetical protein